jgi:predicted O-methyltransferase YrrM
MTGVLDDPALEALLARLHERSDSQVAAIETFENAARRRGGELEEKAFLSDKLVALDRDKAEFCYLLCRALGATRVVEAGTSHGVSTLYLAAAVRDNARAGGARGVVIGTEHEPGKAKVARANFAACGLASFIDLREGDLRETLRDVGGPVDFMLVDIWIPMARPALELVAPHLRRGAIVLADNTTQFREAYADYFAFVNDPKNGLRTQTLPFEGGLELTVRG